MYHAIPKLVCNTQVKQACKAEIITDLSEQKEMRSPRAPGKKYHRTTRKPEKNPFERAGGSMCSLSTLNTGENPFYLFFGITIDPKYLEVGADIFGVCSL